MNISNEDKIRCFDFLSEFEESIKSNFGSYNIDDKHLRLFLKNNGIFLGKYNKRERSKALKSDYYIVFKQDKPHGKKNDIVHHLLRHIRNSIAHCHIVKKGRSKFYIADESTSGDKTMEGYIDKEVFFSLLTQLQQTRI